MHAFRRHNDVAAIRVSANFFGHLSLLFRLDELSVRTISCKGRKKNACDRWPQAFRKISLRGEFELGEFSTLTNVGERLFVEQLTIVEARNQQIGAIAPHCFFLANRHKRTICVHECETTGLRFFARIRDGVLENVVPDTIDLDSRALECELLRVAVNLLKKAAAASERDIVCRPAGHVHSFEDFLEHHDVDAVTLDDPDLIWKNLAALLVHPEAELFAEDIEHLNDDLRRIARVGTHHEGAFPHQDFFPETRAPNVGAGVVDVEAVRDAGDEPSRVLVEQIFERIAFELPAPRSNRGVFGSRNGIARHPLAVVLAGEPVGLQRVRPLEVHEVSHAADTGRFDRGRTAETEVMQLVGDEFRRAVLEKKAEENFLLLTTRSRDRGGIPDHGEQSLHVLFIPVHVFVGSLHRHQCLLSRHDRAFRNRLDEKGKSTTVLGEDVFPASPVEDLVVTEVKSHVFGRFLDGVASDHGACEILFEVVLQAEETGVVEQTAAAFEVAEHGLSPGRGLIVLADFVAVDQFDEVDVVNFGVHSALLRRQCCFRIGAVLPRTTRGIFPRAGDAPRQEPIG